MIQKRKRIRLALEHIVRSTKTSLPVHCLIMHFLIGMCFAASGYAQSSPNVRAAVAPGAIPLSWRDDADLRDVTFVDEDYGWAVGDLGTIWHTQNGGEIWRLQPAPVRHSLSSVHFVDREHGFAVGGFASPLTDRTSGVVLSTKDGGRTWHIVDGLLLPWLTKVHFVSPSMGYAVGASTAMHPTGVWRSRDAGRTWSPLQGVRGQHWVTADFQGHTALLVSRSGSRAWLSQSRLHAAGQSQDFIWNKPYASIINEQIAFANDDGPTLTVNGGHQWVSMGVYPNSKSQLDLTTLATSEASAWLAGSPGTRILHSHDHGRTWQQTVTGVALPFHQLCFHDANHGWAVGAFGLIMKTEDGGRSWQTQRAQSKRAAVLGVFADERDIPWEMLTKSSAAGGYRVHIALINTTQSHDALVTPTEYRVREAAARIGASVEVLTMLPSPAEDRAAREVMQLWDAHSPDSVNKLSSRLTALIRTWRPEVVLTSELPRVGKLATGGQRVVRQLVVDACEYAANENVFPEQLQALGLAPTIVDRLVSVTLQPDSAQPKVRSRDVTALGLTVDELATRSRRLAQTSSGDSHFDQQSWTLTDLQDADLATIGANPMGGIALEFDTAARRPRTVHSIDLAQQKRSLATKSHTKQLLLGTRKIAGQGLQRLENADRMLQSLDRESAGEVLFELAERELAEGDFREADRVLRRFMVDYADHALVDRALEWLVVYHTSLESAWRQQSKRTAMANLSLVAAKRLGPTNPMRAAGGKVGGKLSEKASGNPIRLATAETPASAPKTLPIEAIRDTSPISEADALDWKVGFQLAQQLKSQRPALYAEPRVAFPFASISRLAGKMDPAKSLIRSNLVLPNNSVWRARAQLELALLDPTASQPNVPTWSCPKIERPHLDGDLSDAGWQGVTPQPLFANDHNPETDDTNTVVLIARDDAHLYVAVACRKQDGQTYLPIRRPRPRDPDLRAMDRIELSLDVNRDYTSWWSFEFDHRGWTRDVLLGDASWNPKYFVASAADEDTWTIEVAIPLDQLGPSELHRAGEHWGIGVRRLLPGNSSEKWQAFSNSKAITTPPDLQGLLHLQ